MSQKSGFLIVSNGFFLENVGHTLTKNYNVTYWPRPPAYVPNISSQMPHSHQLNLSCLKSGVDYRLDL